MGGSSQPTNHSEGIPVDAAIIGSMDGAIVEAGPIKDGHRRVKSNLYDSTSTTSKNQHRVIRETIIRSKSSHVNTNNCNSHGNGVHTPSRSMDNTPSHSPLKVQRSLSPHHLSHYSTIPQNRSNEDQNMSSETIRERIHSVPEKTSVYNRSSLPGPPTSQQIFSTPQFHRKDIRSLPSDIGESRHPHPPHPPPKIQPMLIPSGRLPNWGGGAGLAPFIQGGPIVVPNSAPIIRGGGGRIPQAHVLPSGYPQTLNGIVQAPTLGLVHVGLQRLPSYPVAGVTAHATSIVGGGSPSVGSGLAGSISCYNCGRVGHRGSACSNTHKDCSPSHHHTHHTGG